MNGRGAAMKRHTPPLGHKAFTPLYDFAIAALTRESVWRKAFIGDIAPRQGERILDIGSGTGSLAIALCKHTPRVHYVGVDPDADAVRIAEAKAAAEGVSARFETGFFTAGKRYLDRQPDKIVSSLVFHQVPVAEKERIINEIHASLRPGGSVHIAYYGSQAPKLSRVLFRITVQALDGVDDTQPNADGILPELLIAAVFQSVAETKRIQTLTGTISLYTGVK